MKKKTKIAWSAFGSLIGVSAIASATTLPIVLTQNNKLLMTENDWLNQQQFKFNNKNYLSLNEALNDYLNDNHLRTNQFIGNLNYVEPNGYVNVNSQDFKKYDKSKIFPAYKNANGNLTVSYNDARNSYINESKVVTKYYDNKGHYFGDINDAQNSMNSNKTLGIPYYEINGIKQNQKYKINPLNSNDQLKLKEIALEWLWNNIKKDKTIDNINSEKFDIVCIQNNGTINETSKIKIYDSVIQNFQKQYKKFLRKFKVKLANEIIKIIKHDVIDNNENIIGVKLFIKPYFFNLDDWCKNLWVKNMYCPKWFFSAAGELGKKSLDLPSLNFVQYKEIFDTFTNWNVFVSKYNIEDWLICSNGKEEICQKAVPKGTFYSVPLLNKYKIDITYWDWLNSSILKPSRERPGQTLSIGIKPYINKNDKQKIKNKIFNKIINNDEIMYKLLKDSLNEVMSLTSKNDHNWKPNTDSNNNFDTLISNLNEYFGLDKIMKKNPNSNDYKTLKDELYNIFNFDSFLGNLFNDKDKNIYHNFDAISNISHKEIQDRTINDVGWGAENKFPTIERDFLKITGATENEINEMKDSVDSVYIRYIYEHRHYLENNYKFISNSTYKESFTNWFVYGSIFLSHCGENISDAEKTLGLFENGRDAFSRWYFDPHGSIDDYLILEQNLFSTVDSFTGINLNSYDNDFDLLTPYFCKLNEYNFFVTYNDVPLYQINEEFLKNSNQKEYKRFINALFSKSSTYTCPNDFIIDLKENLNKLFINVSTNLVFNNQTVSYTNGNEKLTATGNLLSFVDGTTIKQKLYNLASKNEPPTKLTEGLMDIVRIYNQDIKKLGNNIDNSNKEIINKENNNINNIVCLYNENWKRLNPNERSKTLYYAETLGWPSNLNLSTSNNLNNKVIALNSEMLDEIKIRYSCLTTPEKVYYIYINDSSIPEEKPEYFDTPELALENAKRKFKLTSEKNTIMYENYDNHYISLKNNVFNLYSISIDNKTAYYDSIENLKNAVTTYIKLNSIKINKDS